MSSSSYLESVDSVIESSTNTPTETSSVSSESSVPDNTTTESTRQETVICLLPCLSYILRLSVKNT